MSKPEATPVVITDPVERAKRYRPRGEEIRLNPELPPRPSWMKVKAATHGRAIELETLVRHQKLHTVCESAHCPNRGECWAAGTATIMILGNICTRACGFCAVKTGRPTEYDLEEPARVAATIETMKLAYVVVTSVDRDDLADGGAEVWARTVRAIRERTPKVGIEVLVPDFAGVEASQRIVFEARPHIFAHNLETVKRLHATVRPQARYERTMEILRRAGEFRLITKSGMMLGIGETNVEVLEAMRDLRAVGCSILTLGQYLQPTPAHLPIERWVHPDEFAELKTQALAMGFRKCDAGPLVRSSYHAESAMNPDSELAGSITEAIARDTTTGKAVT